MASPDAILQNGHGDAFIHRWYRSVASISEHKVIQMLLHVLNQRATELQYG
ncbi:hypothetical protein OAU96_00690 [Planctomycetota bacterium]|nr:hypothetical protein [Planctomycetota bacterium]